MNLAVGETSPICGMCTDVINEATADPKNIICRTKLFVVTINPRWSPHLGRVAIAPIRHIGTDGVYGMESLYDKERLELSRLRKNVTDSIVKAFSHYGISRREGCAHIDAIVRPSLHPSLDLFPTYDQAPKYRDWTFPSYKKMELEVGSANKNLEKVTAVLASFSDPMLLMPLELRSLIANDLRNCLEI
jgi:hypothetical protein